MLHPLLFASFPIISLYSANVWQVDWNATLAPMVVSVSVTFGVLLAAVRAFKDWDRGALAVTTVIVLMLAYTNVAFALSASFPQRILLIIWTLIMLLAVPIAVARLHMNLRLVSQTLCVVGLSLVFVPTVSIITSGAMSSPNTSQPGSSAIEVNASAPVPKEESRDIYYIILDRYASAETLEEVYGYDNSEFLAFLEAAGFNVIRDAVANYSMTPLSLASSLNMEYLDTLASAEGTQSSDYKPLYSLMADNSVCRVLRTHGYTHVHVGGSYWEPTSKNVYADVCYSPPGRISEFSAVLLGRLTYLQNLLRNLGVWQHASGQLRKDVQVQWSFHKLAEMPQFGGPKFVFAHFLLPHDPFVFDRHGDYVEPDVVATRSRNENYIEQLMATNTMVSQLISGLLEQSASPPIIIIQADEGPYPPRWLAEPPKWFNSVGATDTEVRQKMGILNAYYLPGVDYSLIPSGTTPVNTFRLLLSLYFDCNYELLPNRSFLSVDPSSPYLFHEVTERLK